MTTYPKRTPVKAIQTFCIECQGESFQAVAECADTACPFYPYRSAATREKARQRSLETDPLGLRNSKKPQAHTPFDAPESTETARAEL